MRPYSFDLAMVDKAVTSLGLSAEAAANDRRVMHDGHADAPLYAGAVPADDAARSCRDRPA